MRRARVVLLVCLGVVALAGCKRHERINAPALHTAPGGTLASVDGKPVELASLWGEGRCAVVTFYRGFF